MKLKMACDYCGTTIVFDGTEPKPNTCNNCNSFIDHLRPVPVAETVKSVEAAPDAEFQGLELVCQKTGAIIKISHAMHTVLGRESTGKEILSSVPQISRKHAQIDFENGQYIITDLGSTNGTFVGVMKIDCKTHPKQVLSDGELVYLGKEPFLVRLIKKDKPEEKPMGVEKTPTQYKCTSCGKEYPERIEICQQCGSYGSLNPVYGLPS